MSHNTNQILLRAKDVTLIISILTLLGIVLGPVKKIFQLEETISKVAVLEDSNVKTKQDVAVIMAQYVDIQKQLEQINWQLRRLNR